MNFLRYIRRYKRLLLYIVSAPPPHRSLCVTAQSSPLSPPEDRVRGRSCDGSLGSPDWCGCAFILTGLLILKIDHTDFPSYRLFPFHLFLHTPLLCNLDPLRFLVCFATFIIPKRVFFFFCQPFLRTPCNNARGVYADRPKSR